MGEELSRPCLKERVAGVAGGREAEGAVSRHREDGEGRGHEGLDLRFFPRLSGFVLQAIARLCRGGLCRYLAHFLLHSVRLGLGGSFSLSPQE